MQTIVALPATLDLNRVDAFVRVVEAGSFTAAAAALRLPKSSVSRAVSRLEAELGVRLLQRTTRQLRLTDAGQAYFQRVQGAVAGLHEASELATGMSKEPRGTIRMTAPVDIHMLGLPEMIGRFRETYPLIQFELELTGRRVDLVDEGFDLALRAGIIQDSTLLARKIHGADLGMYGSKDYLARRGRPTTIGDLARHDGVVLKGPSGPMVWRLNGPRGQVVARPRPTLLANEMSFVEHAVRSGCGIGLLPDVTVYTGPDLVRLFPSFAVTGGGIHVVWPSRQFVPSRVELFRKFLIAELSAWFARCPGKHA